MRQIEKYLQPWGIYLVSRKTNQTSWFIQQTNYNFLIMKYANKPRDVHVGKFDPFLTLDCKYD